MQQLIVDIITGIVKVIQISREDLAASLEEVAAGVRAGKLVPDEAFEKAKATRDETQDARDKLPD